MLIHGIAAPSAKKDGDGMNRHLNAPQPSPLPSGARLVEEVQVRRLLAFLSRHQDAVGTAHVDLIADLDVVVVLRTDGLDPDRVAYAVVVLHDGPGAGESVVGAGDPLARHVR